MMEDPLLEGIRQTYARRGRRSTRRRGEWRWALTGVALAVLFFAVMLASLPVWAVPDHDPGIPQGNAVGWKHGKGRPPVTPTGFRRGHP